MKEIEEYLTSVKFPRTKKSFENITIATGAPQNIDTGPSCV